MKSGLIHILYFGSPNYFLHLERGTLDFKEKENLRRSILPCCIGSEVLPSRPGWMEL